MSEKTKGMNDLEFIRHKSVVFELPDNGHHIRILWPNLAKGDTRAAMSGFGPPPHVFRSDRIDPATERLAANERLFLQGDPSAAPVSRAMLALNNWGETVSALAFDHDRSETAKQKGRVEAAVLALRNLGTQYAVLDGIRVKLEARHADLFAVPKADAAEAIVDVEIRTHFKALDHIEQIKIAIETNPRILLALARAPIKHEEQQQRFIDEAWVAKVTQEQPLQIGDLAIEESMNQWARGFVQNLGETLANPNINGTNGAITQFDLYKILREVDGRELIEWPMGAANSYEQRIAVAA